jgi:hypothetical protein
VLLDDPEATINLSECTDHGKRYVEYIEKCRIQGRALKQELKEMKNDIASTK